MTVNATNQWLVVDFNPSIASSTHLVGTGDGHFHITVHENTTFNTREAKVRWIHSNPYVEVDIMIHQEAGVGCGDDICQDYSPLYETHANCPSDCEPTCEEACEDDYDQCAQTAYNGAASCGSNINCQIYYYQYFQYCQYAYSTCLYECQ